MAIYAAWMVIYVAWKAICAASMDVYVAWKAVYVAWMVIYIAWKAIYAARQPCEMRSIPCEMGEMGSGRDGFRPGRPCADDRARNVPRNQGRRISDWCGAGIPIGKPNTVL